MGRRTTVLKFRLLPLLILAATAVKSFSAGISYTQPGSEYKENFDALPTVFTGNSNIQNSFPDGWTDDSPVEDAVKVGVPGWYLYHPLAPTATAPALPEGGKNGHQRLRFGPGANTGGFWAFGSSADDPEKALGDVGSKTVAGDSIDMHMALRLVNNTGITLTSFTLTFDGEQWRDGQSPSAETLTCGYSLSATGDDWFSTAEFIPLPALSFSAPVFAGTASSGSPINGNVEGLSAGRTVTVSNISWPPLADLWLRWSDPQLAGASDDGLAIDNVVFTASGSGTPPSGIPEAGLSIGKSGTGAWQLQWTGSAGVTATVQHSGSLGNWISEPTTLPEAAGLMTWPIPATLTGSGPQFFRLLRTRTQ